MKWFRLYSEAVNDPKVQALSGDMFKHWINILCIANDNSIRGVLPETFHVAFHLRITTLEAEAVLTHLSLAGLLEEGEFGLEPHHWRQRQFDSDNSYERVKRLRERKVSPTTHTKETEIDTDNRSREKTVSRNVSSPQKKRSKTPVEFPMVTDEFREDMVAKYSDVWDAEEVNARITMVLGSDSILKYHTKEAIETNINVTWLGRDAKSERDRRARNGQYQGNSRQPKQNVQTPRPGSRGYDYTAGIPAGALPDGGHG